MVPNTYRVLLLRNLHAYACSGARHGPGEWHAVRSARFRADPVRLLGGKVFADLGDLCLQRFIFRHLLNEKDSKPSFEGFFVSRGIKNACKMFKMG